MSEEIIKQLVRTKQTIETVNISQKSQHAAIRKALRELYDSIVMIYEGSYQKKRRFLNDLSKAPA